MSARKHAVVIGGSMGGLVAARALAEHYQRVTLVERDRITAAGVDARKGVPQGQHLHGLLNGGLTALEELLPALRAAAVARGALLVDIGELGSWYVGGHAMAQVETGLSGLLIARPALEACVRELVLARNNIACLEGASARGLLGDKHTVRGVVVQTNDGASTEIEADLVVDASGRGSKVHAWLAALGVPPPREEVVRADVTYTSCYIRRRPEHLGGADAFIYGPTPPSLRAGAALAVGRDRYVVTLTGYCGERAPATYADMMAWAASLPVRGLYELLCDAEPCSQPVQMRDPASVRRHYRARHSSPAGLIMFGDALCSFNPSYGQGMSVAALEARALHRLLASGTSALERDFYRAAARIIDVPWSIVVGGDLAFAQVQGRRTWQTRAMNAFFARVARAASRDPEVVRALWKVMHLVAPPSSLFSPSILARVLTRGSPRASEESAVSSISARPSSTRTDAPMEDARP